MRTLIRSTILGLTSAVFVAGATLPASTALAAAGDVRLRANLSGDSPASGNADYRERMKKNVLEQRFSVQVEDAEPGAQLPVLVNGMQFGLIFVDEFGRGEIQFRTESFIDDPGDGSPIPTDFPRLQPGDSVQVGDILFGAF